jgi:hypothetical protein
MLFLPTAAPAILAASLLCLSAHALLPSPLQGREIIEAAKSGRIDRARLSLYGS